MANLMRVRTVFAYGQGSPGLMTQYFGNDLGQYNDADAQIAVDRVRDAFTPVIAIWPPNTTITVGGDVDVLQDTDGAVTAQLAATPREMVGSAGAAMGPLPVGLLLKSTTSAFVSGRRLVGRTYLVPVSAAITNHAIVADNDRVAVKSIGDRLLQAGLTLIFPYVWSRPRAATAVGPHRPAGQARLARVGSSSRVTGYSCSPNFVVLTSRRD